jgi:hypothetical protein
MPSPPSCIRHIIIILPNVEYAVPIFCTASPVTHVALVERKRLSKKDNLTLPDAAIGRLKRAVPVIITARNPAAAICGGFSLIFFRFLKHIIYF